MNCFTPPFENGLQVVLDGLVLWNELGSSLILLSEATQFRKKTDFLIHFMQFF